MKVIRKTILEKILAEIEKDKEDIVRIEVTLKEFEQLLDCLFYNWSVGKNTFSNHCLSAKADKLEHHNIRLNEHNTLSGSYVVIDGVCIQTHKEYGE